MIDRDLIIKQKARLNLKFWLKKNSLSIIFLTFLVCATYVNSLQNGFVSDDKGIVENVSRFDFVFSQAVLFVRPFLNFLIYSISGINPFLFRLPNVFFHLGSVLLVYSFFELKNKKAIALVTSSLFAVHPILVESITWISGGVYAQYSFLFLLSLFLYEWSNKRRYLIFWSVGIFIIALFSSSWAIVFPLIITIYEVSFGEIKKNWKRIFLFFLIAGIYGLIFTSKIGQRATYLEFESGDKSVLINPIFSVPVAFTSYIQLILWPGGLTLYHSELQFSQTEYFIRLIIFLIYIFGIAYSYIKDRFIFFWLSFFIIALLPNFVLSPFGFTWLIAERYVYLGSLGLFVVFATYFTKTVNTKSWRRFAYSIFGLIIMILSIRTIIRNADWSNEDTLWLSAARTSPSSSQNHNNLGDYYGRHGDFANSINEFKKAIALKPNYADAYHNLGNAYRDSGKLAEAIESYKKALSINPYIWQSYQNIAAIYYEQKDYASAKYYLNKGLKTDPQNVNLLGLLGLVIFKMGDKKKAHEIFSHVLTIDPKNQFVKQILLQIQSNTLQ